MDLQSIAINPSLLTSAGLCLFFVAIVHLILRRRWKISSAGKIDYKTPVCIVLGSGGHTAEMLRCVKELGEEYVERHYILSETDSMSAARLRQCEGERKSRLQKDHRDAGTFHLHAIPRSREVRQSYATSIFTTLKAFAACVPLVAKIRPKLVLCNGPGTCVPLVVAARIMDFLFYTKMPCKIVFVESVCRVKSLSLTGRILYHFRLVDKVVVQWEELQKYPGCIYLGRL